MDEPLEGRGLDLKDYLRILLRWWWIPVLGIVGGGVIAFFITNAMTPVFNASAKVLVQGGQNVGVPTASDIEASQQIARTYSDLIKTRPIMERVAEELGLPYGAGVVASKITVSSPRSLILIKASDPDPQVAADLANTTAIIFIDDFRNRQFTQIAQFQTSLSQYSITDEPGVIAAQASTLSTLSVVEDAVASSSASSPRVKFNVFLGLVLGLLAGVIVILVRESLDNSVKSPEDLRALTGMPVLGSVMRYETGDDLGPISMANEGSHGALAESYKFLQTNLEFASEGNGVPAMLLVTSSSPSEGKTTTAANLAISVAKEGKSVILVDADLRKPALHRIFGLQGSKGLTHLLMQGAELDDVLAETELPSLRVIPSGPIPPDATYILRSSRMNIVTEQLRERAEMVIFDSPPLLSVTDPMVVAPLVDGVLLVVDVHRTGRETVKRGGEILKQAHPALSGAVLNKVTPRGGASYYYYYYYYHYYSEDGVGKRFWNFRGLPARLRKGLGRRGRGRGTRKK